MTQEEAISLLNKITSYCYFIDGYGDMIDSTPYYEAVELAIKALEQQNKSEILTSPDPCNGCRYELNSTNGNPCYSCGKYKLTEQEPCEDCISREETILHLSERLYETAMNNQGYEITMDKACEDCISREEVTDIILSIARNLEHICEVIKNDKRRGYKLS